MKQLVICLFMAWTLSSALASCNNTRTVKGQPASDTTAQTETTGAENAAMDAAKVAPDRYKVLKEGMGIRVLELNYKPGDAAALHSHPDNVLYVLSGGKTEFTDNNGHKEVVDVPSGAVSIGPAETHSVKNIGTTSVRAILVEVTRPNRAAARPAGEKEAVGAAPGLYKVLKDTMNMRVLLASYKPGESSPMHYHPDNAVYFLEPAKTEFTKKDGSKEVRQMDKGAVLIAPAGTHSVKNIGTAPSRVLVVEVNRPAQ